MKPHYLSRAAFITINTTAIVFNATLIPIIFFRSSKFIDSYKYLLLGLVTVEMSFAITLLISLPYWDTNAIEWTYCATLDIMPFWVTQTCVVFVAGFLLVVPTIFALSFVYRYGIVCNQNVLIWFKEPLRIASLVIICFMVFFGACCNVIYFFVQTDDVKKNFTDLHEHDHFILETQGCLMSGTYDSFGNLNPKTGVALFEWIFNFCVFGILSSTLTYRMIKTIRHNEQTMQMSPQTLKAQKKLLLLLVLQTVFPIFFSFIPCWISYVSALLRKENGDLTEWYTPAFSLSNLFDPLLIFIFVTDYRRAIIELSWLRRSSKTSPSTTASAQLSNNMSL